MRNDRNIPTTLEKQFVEAPFLKQLESFKWTILRLDRWNQTEAQTGRTSWIQTVMMNELENSICRLNSWLDKVQVTEIAKEITTFQKTDFITNNSKVLDLILHGTEADDRNTGEKSKPVKYIDLNHPELNSYIAVSEMRFRIPLI